MWLQTTLIFKSLETTPLWNLKARRKFKKHKREQQKRCSNFKTFEWKWLSLPWTKTETTSLQKKWLVFELHFCPTPFALPSLIMQVLKKITKDKKSKQIKTWQALCFLKVTQAPPNQIWFTLFVSYLRWFPHNIWAIMANIKFPKELLSMVIFWIKVRRSYRDLSSQANPARENSSYPYFS